MAGEQKSMFERQLATLESQLRAGPKQADPDAATMTKFQAEQSSYSRGDIVLKAGWASLDGKTAGNDQLARACADKLHIAKAG